MVSDETHGLTVFTTNILSDEEAELDLTNQLSQIKEKEVKVTILFEYENESKTKYCVKNYYKPKNQLNKR